MNVKSDFPIFNNNPNLVYLDSAATSQKPQVVLDKVTEYYEQYNSNIHRGIYKIAEKATAEYEEARSKIAKFINAASSDEIVFTSGTTQSINLLSHSLEDQIGEGDEIVVTIADHHSNFVPWQQLAKKKGAKFVAADVLSTPLIQSVTEHTRILAFPLISNTLGTVFPVKEIVAQARKISPHIYIIVDAAQSVPHRSIDVRALDADFVAFSGHKMCGPTSIGVLWGKAERLKNLPPYQFGGEMIEEVRVESTTFKDIPYKFEAGTPPIAQAIGLGAAIDYLSSIGMDKIEEHEKSLVEYARAELEKVFSEKINILGPGVGEDRGGLLSFTFGKYHAHDVAQILDEENICVRAGHHCTMPLHNSLGVNASIRASFYIYNDESDVNKLIAGLKKVENYLQPRR